jgi:hypothetical protein
LESSAMLIRSAAWLPEESMDGRNRHGTSSESAPTPGELLGKFTEP